MIFQQFDCPRNLLDPFSLLDKIGLERGGQVREGERLCESRAGGVRVGTLPREVCDKEQGKRAEVFGRAAVYLQSLSGWLGWRDELQGGCRPLIVSPKRERSAVPCADRFGSERVGDFVGRDHYAHTVKARGVYFAFDGLTEAGGDVKVGRVAAGGLEASEQDDLFGRRSRRSGKRGNGGNLTILTRHQECYTQCNSP